ncbi:Neurotransmitter-gated ion-channel ligand-binding domain-containing protein [Caenorhabditis elegans]|uniref:Neurotransmitter-gated ion-channel ligand-binding domain-containing protein n=1 Tax=Caenorhabditis elegans TaxID=6239 RepID=A0A2K5ATQ0_CAEEL|nr:Neurotransmitter-gated ion-channel ligand-binding domain-containing protein [Caenorhabditis elegans]SPC47282.1 Neurotransmitter-gated ion-channel ligand-binding domain-containing protein [Caenorhabditis elegans]|eukprot:NP_001348695.1 Ligand-Gated ion Channel [Caenorhabditis elegans]
MSFLVLFGALLLIQTSEQMVQCRYTKNLTNRADGGDEHCLFYYLLNKEYEKSGSVHSLSAYPPNSDEMTITIENVLVKYVELVKGSSYQFNVFGDIYLNWKDERMKWDKKGEFENYEHLYIFNSSAIWTPHVIDHTLCSEGGCSYSVDDVDIYDDGTIYARIQFKYLASCTVDYRKFPEEDDSCCIFFTAFEPNVEQTTLVLEGKEKEKMNRPVYAQKIYEKEKQLSDIVQEHSPWVVVEKTMSTSNLGGLKSLQVMQVCVRAEKQMSTVRVALLFPVTLATYVMLASPLFGDLRTQIYVKLFSLHIQTLCFLYLCTITPLNGFLGVRPRIYIFYELIFTISFMSILVTLVVMALSRVKRNVPPSHRLFLSAKLINRVVCCIEPERSDAYHRYVEEDTPESRTTSELDYTQDWRHIYLAMNNMFSALMFSVFLFMTFLEFF